LEKIESQGYAEVPESEVLKFEVGDFKELKLTDVQSFERDGKTRYRYQVEDLSDYDKEKTLFGSAHIDSLFSKLEINDQFALLRIEDKKIPGKGFPMKSYKLFVKEN